VVIPSSPSLGRHAVYIGNSLPTFRYNIWVPPSRDMNPIISPCSCTMSEFSHSPRLITFDKRLKWKHHITQTRKHLNLKTRELYWIRGRHSPLSPRNKTLMYKVVLIPVWTDDIELWGCAFSSNIAILQRYQSKTLLLITQAPRCVTSQILHRDLGIAPVREIFKRKAESNRKTLSTQTNPLMGTLNSTTSPETER
jgi:hypothetical protein